MTYNGASNHMTGSLETMLDVGNCTWVPMGLLNGGKTFMTKIEKAVLEKDITLQNVLYVLKLTCSLISIC